MHPSRCSARWPRQQCPCSVENLLMGQSEDHQIVGQHAQQTLTGLRFVAGGPHGRSQDALILADGALDLPPLAVDAPVKLTLHLRPVMAQGRRVGPALVDRNHRRADAQLPAAQGVVMLGVVGGIGQHTVQPQVPCGLTHRRAELGRVVAGPTADHRPRKKVRGAVADHSQLRPILAAFELSAPGQVVEAGLAGLQPSGVDGGFGPLLDQAAASGSGESSRKERLESPPFSRRASA